MGLQEALKAYESCFGESYHFYVGIMKNDKEIIAEIQKCIMTGKKQRQPRYERDKVY